MAGRQAPLRPVCAVDRGGLFEGLLPAPVVPRYQRRARQEARQVAADVAGRPAPFVPRAREVVAAREPAGAEGAAPSAPEDASGRDEGEAAGDGERGPGPAGGDL